MDWNRGTHDAAVPTTPEPSSSALIETVWRLRAPSGRVLTCGIYRDAAPGLDVRCGFSDEDLVRSQRAAEIGRARELADEWRRAAIAKGFVEVVDDGKGAM
jgi:hypothetical protein